MYQKTTNRQQIILKQQLFINEQFLTVLQMLPWPGDSNESDDMDSVYVQDASVAQHTHI